LASGVDRLCAGVVAAGSSAVDGFLTDCAKTGNEIKMRRNNAGVSLRKDK
jgi:hypothetical protein